LTIARVVGETFGHLPGGEPVERATLRGAGGFEVAIITFGAAIQALHAPDCEGPCTSCG
jgi:aldose 1-epimerase